MKRRLYDNLLSWKNSRKRKPLLLQGARQVGKTYLVSEFGQKAYKEMIYLNFEQEPDLGTLFQNKLKPDRIIDNMSLYLGRKISHTDTLIFFDEIQAVPEVLTSLKYFNEETPEYHIIAAGSLLGVSVGKQSSFPVGKVNFLMLHPMSFPEYLVAVGEELLAKKLTSIKAPEPLPDILHEKLLTLLKMYLYLGGMPEVIQDYLDNNDMASCRKVQIDILEAYQRDFSKYAEKSQTIKTSELWQSIPRQLARENKKFKYSNVRKQARSATFYQTIEWLKKTGLINVVYNISMPKLPLAGYADYSKFKIYLLDSGLLGAMLDLSSSIILKPNELFSEYNGAFIENYIASELVASSVGNLYYWTSRSDAEVDFVLQRNNDIYPLEVKSGLSRNTKSLRSYADKYNPTFIYRCSPRNFMKSGDFINIPLYACFLLNNC